MNRTPVAIFVCCFLFMMISQTNGQETKKVISYSKTMGDSRIMVLRSDNTLWWYAPKKSWTAVNKTGLPNIGIKDIEVYQKPAMMGTETRLIVLMDDNSIYWYAEGKDWELIESTGLPAGAKVKDITVFLKSTGFSNDARIVALMEDGSLWWFAPKKDWEKVPLDGLGGK
ncbi:hypothetical protein [Paraflavitalea soli]|nr:hypothetical protein [Paraflavitalea soli]